jgi:hypothetical protein
MCNLKGVTQYCDYLAVINFIIITRQLFFISVHLSSIVSIFFLNINALI